MTHTNGISAFELLSGLDDGMIAAATLPEEGGIITGKRSRKDRDDREPSLFARFMDSNWAAAIISMTVALAVLMGIVAAGRMAPKNSPSDGLNGPGVPAGTHQDVLEGVPGQSDGFIDNENNEPMAPEENPEHEPNEVPGEAERQPVNSLVTGQMTVTVGSQTFAPLGMVTSWVERTDDGGTIATDEGTPALDRLEEVRNELTQVVSHSGGAMLITIPEDTFITKIIVYNEAMERVVRDKRAAITPELPVGEYLVEVGIRRMRTDGTGEDVEYLFLLTVEENTAEEILYITAGKESCMVTGYPLYKSYYDSELGEQVNVEMPGATANLEALHDELSLVTLIQEKSFDLIPVNQDWELVSLDLYDDGYAPLGAVHAAEIPYLDPQVYTVVATYIVKDGVLEMAVEFPFRLAIHEKEVETVKEPNLESEPETEWVAGETQFAE